MDPAVVVVVGAAVLAAAYLMLVAEPAWLLSAGVVLSVFSGHWERMGISVGLDRIALALGIVALLARLGPARDRPPLRLGATHVLLLAAGLYAICSALWAGTLSDSAARFRLLDSFALASFVLYAVAPVAFVTAKQRAILLG